MTIKILAQIEVSVDERFSRVDNVSITLDDEALSQIAKALATQQSAQADECDCLRSDGIHDLFCAVEIKKRNKKRRR